MSIIFWINLRDNIYAQWNQQSPFPTGGDLNGVTADSYSMQITVHKNLGQGVFPVPNLFERGTSTAGSLDAAYIDNDGDLDVIEFTIQLLTEESYRRYIGENGKSLVT